MEKTSSQPNEEHEGSADEPERLPADSKKKTTWPDRLAKLKEDLLKVSILWIPLFLIDWVLGAVVTKFTSQPWHALWFIVPMVVIGVILWKRAEGQTDLILRPGPFLYFLIIYIIVFGVAAQVNFLDWKRTLVGFEAEVPPNWLGLNRLGDWRYRLVRKKPPDRDIIIVTMPPYPDSAAARSDLSLLFRTLSKADAPGVNIRGLALDAYFEGTTDLDNFLCRQVGSFRHPTPDAEKPVFSGYTFERVDGEIERKLYPPPLEACLPYLTTQGHVVGYREADNKVRAIPLFFLQSREEQAQALSLRIACWFKEDPACWRDETLPSSLLLQFVAPADDFKQIPFDSLLFGDVSRILKDKFIFIGSDTETVDTPFSTRRGVEVHAYAVHSLRHNHFITRTPWWSGFLLLLVCFYLVTIQTRRGVPAQKLLLLALGLSLFVILAAGISMYFWLVWLDVIYILIGTWMLVPLLLGLRKAIKQ